MTTHAPLQPNTLPIELRHVDQWVAWRTSTRDGTETKIPLDPANGKYASTTDAATWSTFDTALEAVRTPDVAGIGFVFTDIDPYVGIDLDDCRVSETGTLAEPAASICAQLDSYTEVSPSGTGVHVIVRGRLPDGARRCGTVEMYDTSRFFTMTGVRLAAMPATVCERTAALRAVHQAHVASTEDKATRETAGTQPSARLERPQFLRDELDDDTLLTKAQRAANGEKFTRLWRGSTTGYPSQSEADLALCCLLAFWTGGDAAQMDRLFRQSGLMRAKWDAVHFADGATYGERTIERAIAGTDGRYDGNSDSR